MILSLCVTIVVLLLDYFLMASAPLLLGVNVRSEDIEEEVTIVSQYARYFHIKLCNLTKNGMDMVVELRVKKNEADLVREIGKLSDVDSASLFFYYGETAI